MTSAVDDLPVPPPVYPMLAKSVAGIPPGHRYEPKWDGFRAIVYRSGDEVQIGSRNTKPIARYFPEVVASVLAGAPDRCVLDGEIIVPSGRTAGLDFEALLQRIHPATSRVELLARTTPALFVAFDLLALGDESFLDRPFHERRAAMAEVLSGLTGPCFLTRTTLDSAEAVFGRVLAEDRPGGGKPAND